jgi:hypothetical protein
MRNPHQLQRKIPVLENRGRGTQIRFDALHLGHPPVSLKAAKDALLKVMPESKADAKPMLALFEFAVVPSRTTGQKALNELLSDGKIQRIGKGGPRNLFRYFATRGEK